MHALTVLRLTAMRKDHRVRLVSTGETQRTLFSNMIVNTTGEEVVIVPGHTFPVNGISQSLKHKKIISNFKLHQ